MKNGRKLWFVMLVTSMLLTLFLSACGKGGSSEGSSSDPVTITYYTIDSPDRTFVEKLIPDFESKHPNIKVKVDKAPYEQFDSKLQANIAAKKSPDITSHFGYGGFMEYYNKGLLTDLTDIMKADNFKASDYGIQDELMNIYKVDGKTYGIPSNNYVTLMLYNKDMFDKAGVSYPPSDYEDKSWTFDKMIEMAKKLTVVSDDITKTQYGVDFGWGELDMRPAYFGAKVYSDDAWTNGGKPSETYFGSPEAIAAYQKWIGLIWDQKVAPPPAFSKAVAGQFGDPFLSGKIGMSVVGSWSLASQKDFNFKVGVAAVPIGGNPDVRSVLYVDPLFVLKDSKHPKEAYEFIKYMLTTEVQEKSIELSGGTPPVNDNAKEKYYNSFEGVDPQVIKQVYEGANKYGVESYNHLISNYSQLNELLINEFQSVQNGDQKVEAALPGIQEKITKLLERLNK
ncbi:sugar ABC transporter substrate-binding protein [Paenibacillus terrigena]|uniref:ABC transporter substrate-binding protein n=1 Tax=Paenibacillus terrigena TaxID=369333 RepID=UPI0028D366CD|nr:sugar ABC transporter substrate-binding protein [Paenibacillus terrigena]